MSRPRRRRRRRLTCLSQVNNQDFRADINGLRGISIALVVAYHLQVKGAGGGFIGVDVFFVISGFLMTRIIWHGLADDRFSIWRFVAARAARIWPALAVLLLSLIAAGVFWLPPFDMRTLAAQGAWALPLLSNHYFREHSGYNTQGSDDLWLLHTWSLSVEWQFYLLYPLLLCAVVALVRRRGAARSEAGLRYALSVAVGITAALSCGWQWFLTPRDPEGGFFLLSARAWELLIGAVVCLAAPRAPGVRGRWRVASGYAGLALVLLSALVIALLRQRPVGLGIYLLAPVLGVSLILWANDQHNVILRHRWLQSLGRWSYSVYLWHWPIIVALRLTTWSGDYPRLSMLAAAAASGLAGWLSYRYVERLGATQRSVSAWRIVSRPALLMALAGTTTLGVATSDGLAWRARESDTRYLRYDAEVRPLLFPEHCSNFKKSAEQFKVCTIHREGGSRRVLVIGDSHAEHLWPWFVKHSRVSVDFFPASECPPVPRFERLQPGYHCLDYAAMAWQKASSAAYDTVIVSARWATVGLLGPPYCHQRGDGPCARVTMEQRQALTLVELRGAIERTLKAGKIVVVFDNAPESRFRVVPRLAREAFWHGDVRLTIDAQATLAQTAWIDKPLRALQAEAGFHLVSLRDRLCNESTCLVHDSTLKRPVYYDESHFDPVWIAENGGVFAPFVNAN